jgi:hypothetical protein
MVMKGLGTTSFIPRGAAPTQQGLVKKRKLQNIDTEDAIQSFKRVRVLLSNPSSNNPPPWHFSLYSPPRRVFQWVENNRSWEDSIYEQRRHALKRKLLQEQGLNTSSSMLQRAALRGDLEAIKFCLFDKMNINKHTALTVRPDISTVLHWTALYGAIEGNQSEMVSFLASHGADVNIYLPQCGTPLVMAVGECRGDLVEILLNHGADLNLMSKCGFQPDPSVTAL